MAHKLAINVCTGSPGSGKTTWMADRTAWLLEDNRKSEKRMGTGKRRRVVSNIHFAPSVEARYGVGDLYRDDTHGISYWADPEQLVDLRDCDVLIDEMPTYFDSMQYALMPLSLKRWFQQHRKLGIAIYGTAQDFGQVDISIRRLTHNLRWAKKWDRLSTRDLAANMPAPRYPFGIISLYLVSPKYFTKDVSEYKFQSWLPELLFFNAKSTSLFNTREEILPGTYPPLRKIVRVCPEDGYRQVKYI